MATFKLTNGYSVQTRPFAAGTELVTSNADDEVISSVRLYGEAAAETLTNLRIAERLAAL